MTNLTTREFWASAAERAVKTAAQTAIALIGTEAVGVFNLDWAQIGSVVATATILSLLTSIAGDTAGKNGPSFVRSEGIGIENAEAEEALRREWAGETIDTSSAVSFESDASEGNDDERPLLFGDPDDPEETGAVETAGTDVIDDETSLEALAAAEVDDTPPPDDYEPRH